jgi:ABC-type multidrug transport system ATPase subunit
VLYLLADQCAWNECVSGFQDVDPEVIKCLVQLYLNAIVYFIIGVYLEQVVPSTFGVPRHPLFFLETTIKQNLPRLYIILFTEEGKLAKHVDTTLEGEDIDVRRERSAVNNLMKEDYQYYPLVIKDIQKIYPGIIDNQPKIANKSITFKINKGELFGLLGPNGAGKTTLMQ